MKNGENIIPNVSGIYKILNLNNGKYYVGSAKNLRIRKNLHFSNLRLNKHENPYLQNAWNKDSGENFIFEVMELCEPSQLIEKEQYWIDISNCCNKEIGYNLVAIAYSRLRVKHSDKSKRLMSEGHKGKIISDDTRKLLLSYSSQPKSEETKLKISNSLKGKIYTEERKLNMSLGKKRKIKWTFIDIPAIVE